MLTLLDTPVELSQDVIKQDVTEGLKILGEDITDGIQCMVAGGGHPLCFLQVKHNLCEFFFFLIYTRTKNTMQRQSLTTRGPKQTLLRTKQLLYLSLLLRKLHVVKDPEDNSEQVLPPVFLEGVAIGLHHFKHHCQPPGK